MNVPTAPWIRETERTGHYRFGFWNQPQENDAIICDRCGSLIDTDFDWFVIDGETLCESCMDEIEEEVRLLHGE